MRSGSLLEAKNVPALTEVCLRHALHWNNRRAVICAIAPRTLEPIRPAPFDERRMALLFGAIDLGETGLAEAFLELNLIARHRRTPAKTACSCFVLPNI